MQRTISRALVGAFALGASLVVTPAFGDSGNTARWATVIGIMQAGNVVGSGTGAVQGGGQPWSALGGSATVDLRTGRFHFDVRGLVLAGGNAIGTPGPITSVMGTLVCDTNGSAGGGNSVLVDTPAVALDDEGNARFEGSVALPAVCTSEPDFAFLIRIPGAGRWIANGSVLR